MQTDGDEPELFSPEVLDRAGRLLRERLADGSVADDRRSFLEGVEQLGCGNLEEANASFRRAARSADPPFDAMARVARGECERLRGKLGLAIRQWRRVAEDDRTAPAPRYMAWLSLAAVAESRGDDQLLKTARQAIATLEHSEQI